MKGMSSHPALTATATLVAALFVFSRSGNRRGPGRARRRPGAAERITPAAGDAEWKRSRPGGNRRSVRTGSGQRNAPTRHGDQPGLRTRTLRDIRLKNRRTDGEPSGTRHDRIVMRSRAGEEETAGRGKTVPVAVDRGAESPQMLVRRGYLLGCGSHAGGGNARRRICLGGSRTDNTESAAAAGI